MTYCWLSPLAVVAFALAPMAATAQGVDDNAVASASDAFGLSVGNEKIGIYSASDVRGFNPVDAGNTRIEGLYFAPIDGLPTRLLRGSAVRVGIAAQGYSFPAPTGIVDYQLNISGTRNQALLSFERGQFGSLVANGEGQIRVSDTTGAYAGGSFRAQNRHEGGDYLSYNFAGGLVWRPYSGASVTGFAGSTRTYDDETPPSIFPGGDYLPPEIERRAAIGQSWSDRDNRSTVFGGVAKLPFGPWQVEAGLFNTRRDTALNFTDLFLAMRPDGTTPNRVLIVDADNRDRMLSGEVRLTRTFGNAALAHRLILSARGRKGDRRFGGAQRIPFGESSLLFADERTQPQFLFGPDDRDKVDQATVGIGYSLTSPRHFSLDVALSASRYHKTIEFAASPTPVTTHARPITGSVTGTYNIARNIALYGGFVRGFEEVAVAPANAVNRGAAPPAIQTEQGDIGLRFSLTPQLSLVVGLFSITKPYFNIDSASVYRELGNSSSRGVELSLAGTVQPGLTFVLGHVSLDAKISGELVDNGTIGPRPIASIRRRSALNVDWRLNGGSSPLSFDLAVESLSSRVGNASNRLSAPPRDSIDLGLRYRFNISKARSLLRLQVTNVLDDYGWLVFPNGAFMYSQGRRVLAELRLDFP
ncbi:MAG: TonB-dependent receptor [Sphingobium sp.]|nr:TonB-dependent receptor [Sphingobium sp.]